MSNLALTVRPVFERLSRRLAHHKTFSQPAKASTSKRLRPLQLPTSIDTIAEPQVNIEQRGLPMRASPTGTMSKLTS
jgi:hypothetical protein